MPLDTSWMDSMPVAQLPAARPSQDNLPPIQAMVVKPDSAAVPASGKPDTSWMDAMPAAAVPDYSSASKQQLAPNQKSGLLANIGAGLVDAGGSAINTALDAGGNLIGKPLATAAVFAHDALAPMFGGQRFPDDVRNMLLGDNVQQPGSQAMDAVARGIGAPSPSDVVPVGDAQRLARKATTNAALMVGAGPLGMAAGAGGALTGDLAGEMAPAWAAPMAELAGNIGGGGLVGAGATAAGRLGGAAVNGAKNFVAPMSQAGVERLAGQRIIGAASDPAAVRAALNNPPAPLVENSEPTTYQMTGDNGFGQLERAVGGGSGGNQPDFVARYNRQNAARVDAINAPQPDGDPAAVGQAFRSQLQAMDAANEAALSGYQRNARGALADAGGVAVPEQNGDVMRGAVDTAFAPKLAAADADVNAATGGAQNATAALGNAPPVGGDQQASVLQRFGEKLQGGLDALNAKRKEGVSALYAMVDPDGTLAVDMQPFKAQVKDIAASWPKNAKPLEGEAGAVFGTARFQPAVQKFSEVTALRQRIGDAMAAMRSNPEMAQAYRQLTQLRAALDDTLSGAVAEKAAADANAVNSGAMAPNDSIMARLNQQGPDATQGTSANVRVGAQSDGTPAAMAGENDRGSAPGLPSRAGVASTEGYGNGAAGEQPQSGGNPGRMAGGDRGVSSSATDGLKPLPGSNRKPESLIDYLISKGGIRDERGDLGAMDAQLVHHRAAGRLVNPKGAPLDYAREGAVQEGFLPANADINDLLDAVHESLSGNMRYRAHEQADGANWGNTRAQSQLADDARYGARDAVNVAAERMGVQLRPGEIDHATEMHMQGADVHQAVEDAIRASEHDVLQRNAQASAFGRPGVPPGAEQADLGVPETGLTANFDAEALARRRAADAAHAERMQTYGSKVPGVGAVLKPGARPGEFAMPASKVPAELFTPGKAGAERIQAFQKAAAADPSLHQTLQDYAAFSFRRAAEDADGTIDASKAATWRKNHAEVMGAFPELADKFDTAIGARQAMDEAVARRDALAKTYPIKPNTTNAEIALRYFRSGPGGAEAVGQFMRHTNGSPVAVRALEDHAAWSLRQAAEGKDGTLDVAAYQRWAKAHDSALSAMPELAKKFATAADARAALDDAAVRMQSARDAYQTSAVSRLMGEADPVLTVGRILNSDSAVTQMQDLARKTAGDPAARAGLRRAVVEHILNNLRSNQEAAGTRLLKNDAFQTFVRKTPAALRTIFSADEVQSIQNVAADLQRSQKSVSGTKLPGGSNTAQDLAAGEKHGGHGPSVLNSVIAAELGGELLHHAAGLPGKILGMVATPVINAMRSAGMEKVNDLVTEAMLNPALAKTLVAKIPTNPHAARSMSSIIAGQIRAISAISAITSNQGKDNR